MCKRYEQVKLKITKNDDESAEKNTPKSTKTIYKKGR
jgi:hypothetical protein